MDFPAFTRRSFLAGTSLGLTTFACHAGPDQLVPLLDAGARLPDAGEPPSPQPPPSPDAGARPPDPPDAEPHDGGGSEDASTEDAGAEDAGDSAIDPQTIPEAPNVFTLGVACGDPTSTSAILWTKAETSSALALLVWPEGELDAQTRIELAPSTTPFVLAEVTDLQPGRWYSYTFLDGSRRSAIGRFRTAIDDTALEIVMIAASACTSNIRRRFPTLEAAGARDDLDLFVLLGDTTYNDGAESLGEYRDRWAQNLEKDGYRAIRGATSVIGTWDDHEVGNNWDPETIDPAQLAAATGAFFEHIPVRRSSTAPNRIWRSIRWGATVEIFVLDGRSERKPSTRDAAGAEYLSREQMDWLKSSLAASTAVFKLIVNSVPIASFSEGFNLGEVLLDFDDRWEGYPAAREELLSFIEDQQLQGVIFLSGDFHLAYTGRAALSGIGSSVLEVLAGPGAQFPNPLAPSLRPPQFDFATARMNYTELRLDPASRQLRVRYFDDDGAQFAQQTYTL